MPKQEIYIFESLEDLSIWKHLGHGQPAISFEDFYLPPTPLPPTTVRIESLNHLLQSGTHSFLPEKLLYTIEYLREAMISSSQDVEYCFSQLKPTAKNKLLAQAFHHYLDSPLVYDRTYFKALVQKELNEHQEKLISGYTHLKLVPAVAPSHWFESFYQSLLQHAPQHEVHKCDLEATCSSDFSSAPPEMKAIRMESWPLVRQLVTTLVSNLQNDPGPLVVGIEAFDYEVDWLCLELERAQIDYYHGLGSLRGTPNYSSLLSLYHQKLAGSENLSLKRLHEISSMLFSSFHRFHPQKWTIQIQALHTEGKLSSQEHALLLQLVEEVGTQVFPQMQTRDSSSLPLEKAQVLLCPIRPLGHAFSSQYLTLVTEKMLQPDPPEIMLDGSELESLSRKGFPLSDSWEVQEQRKKMIQAIGDKQHCCWMGTSLPESSLRLPFSAPPAPQQSQTPVFSLSSFQATLAQKSFSATQLEAYAQCPTQYLFQNRLRLQPIQQTWQERFALWLGLATHHGLEKCLEPYKGEKIPHPFNLSSLNEHFENYLKSPSVHSEVSGLGQLALRKQFHGFLAKLDRMEEALDAIFGPRTLFATEHQFETEIEGMIFTGKIDRIDKLSDGSLLILDYKTGKVGFSPNQIATGKHFQSLIYLLAMEQQWGASHVAGAIFYDLKEGEVKRGMVKSECAQSDAKKWMTRGHIMPDEKMEALKLLGTQAIAQIVQAIRRGNFEPTPSSSTCMFCSYGALCRRSAHHG